MRYEIVFHVDHDATCMNIALSNIANTVAPVPAPERELVLVLNGPAAQFARKDAEFADAVAGILGQDVAVRVCENAMAKFAIQPGDLVPGCEPVPGGILELAQLQQKGFTYIKP
ncbi:DsrE family protein [Desulfocurvus sp. DL9XJH121]